MAFSLFVLGWIFVLGLVIGSFLNVVILRTVSGESIVFPSSKCPKCQTPLKWYHNIPVFSYLFLRGKCAFCKEPISIQYPLVELFTGILFLALFIRICKPIDPLFGLSVMPPIGWFQVICYIFALIVSGFFIAIAGTDILEKKVSDAHTIPLIALGLLFSLLYTAAAMFIFHTEGIAHSYSFQYLLKAPVICSLAAGIAGFVIMEIAARPGYLLVGTRAFGEGDSYIAAGLGTVFGGYYAMTMTKFSPDWLMAILLILSILVLSIAIQAVVITPIFLVKLYKKKNWMTFGALSAFLIYTVSYVLAGQFGWLENTVAYWSSTIVLAALGLFVCKEILTGLKNKVSEGLYLPFGPAMIAAGFFMLFWLSV